MKYCPRCQQVYTDGTLNFCLEDGTPLATSSSLSEATLVLGPNQRYAKPTHGERISLIPHILIGIFALVAGGAIVALFLTRSTTPPAINVPETTNPTPVANTAANSTSSQKVLSNRPSEVVEYPDVRPEPMTADAARNIISVWERSQDGKSFASYQACYASSFVGVKKTKSGRSQTYSYSSWMADRRKMIASAVNLSVELQNLHIRVDGDTAIVQFDQYYRSLRYSDWGPKEIVIKMTPSGPKIVREELKASYPL